MFMEIITRNCSNNMEEKLKGLNVYLAKEEEKLRMTCLYLWRVSLGFQIK